MCVRVCEALSMFTLCSFLYKYKNMYSELITNVFNGFLLLDNLAKRIPVVRVVFETPFMFIDNKLRKQRTYG